MRFATVWARRIAAPPLQLPGLIASDLAYQELYLDALYSEAISPATEAVEAAIRLGPDRGETASGSGVVVLLLLSRLRPGSPPNWRLLAVCSLTNRWSSHPRLDRPRQDRWQDHLRNVNRALELDPRNVFILPR